MDVIKTFAYLLGTLLLSTSTIAQTPANTTTRDGSSYDIATNSTLGLHNYGKATALSYDEIDGSPYFNDEFVQGQAYLNSGTFHDSLLLRYDLATHTFNAKLEDDSQIAIDSRYVREFRLFTDEGEILFKRVDPKKPQVFYEILYQEKGLTVYKSEEVSMVKGEDLGISKSNDRFFSKVKYYVKKGKEIERVKLKKKHLWKFFSPEQQAILNNHIKKNNIKLKKDKDYRSAFNVLTNYS